MSAWFVPIIFWAIACMGTERTFTSYLAWQLPTQITIQGFVVAISWFYLPHLADYHKQQFAREQLGLNKEEDDAKDEEEAKKEKSGATMMGGDNNEENANSNENSEEESDFTSFDESGKIRDDNTFGFEM